MLIDTDPAHEELKRQIAALKVDIGLLRGSIASLETRFDGTDVKKRSDELHAATEKITMDAERAIRTILDAAGKLKP